MSNFNKTPLNIHRKCTSKFPFRGGYRAAATSKMELFVIIFNGFQPLTIITKRSILDVPVALDPPLMLLYILIIYTHSSIESNLFVKLPQF